MKFNVLTAAVLTSGLAMAGVNANAAMTTDGNGNVGYDTYDECVMAVKDGSAKYYTPYTYQEPMPLAGEASVAKMRLSEVMIPQRVVSDNNLRTADYEAGACDLGVGQSNGRYGVSGALVGKYVPFDDDMPVNVYLDTYGNPVRVTMQQCDNHFSGAFPTPVVSEVSAPPAQIAIEEERIVEPVVVQTRRVIRPSTYRVKEIVVAPEEQIRRYNTVDGTVVGVEGSQNTVILGQQADHEILDNVEISQTFPIIQVPVNDTQRQVVDPNTGRTIIIE